MPTISEILEDINNAEANGLNDVQVQELILSLGKMYFLIYELHNGRIIHRARKGSNYTLISDIGCPESHHCGERGRANLPNQPMFYGCILPYSDKNYTRARYITATEISNMLDINNQIEKGQEKITYGRWENHKDISLVVIIHSKLIYDGNFVLRNLQREYKQFIKEYPDKEEDVLRVADFFADKFADPESNYFLTSNFTKVVTDDLGYDGIVYPSTQAGDGEGFCIAIKRDSVISNLDLQVVLECTLYKNNNKAILIDDKQSTIKKGESNFVLNDTGTETTHVLEELEIDSLDELPLIN